MSQPAGIIVPVATPLDEEGDFNETAFRDILRAQIPHVDGIFALGSSGEFAWLPDAMAAQVRRVAREETKGKLPLYIGVGGTSLPRTLETLRQLSPGDAEFVVANSPYYFPVGQAALVEYFTMVADHSPSPVVLYNIPQNTGLSLSTASILELAAHPNVVGIKDSAGDMFAFLEMLNLRSDGFSVLQGREQLLVTSFVSGADGIVSSLGNIAPSLIREAIDASVSGALQHALELQRAVTEVAELFGHGYWVAALKSALNSLGFAVGSPVAPMPPCTGAEAKAIADILAGAKAEWLISAERTRG